MTAQTLETSAASAYRCSQEEVGGHDPDWHRSRRSQGCGECGWQVPAPAAPSPVEAFLAGVGTAVAAAQPNTGLDVGDAWVWCHAHVDLDDRLLFLVSVEEAGVRSWLAVVGVPDADGVLRPTRVTAHRDLDGDAREVREVLPEALAWFCGVVSAL